LIGTSAQVSTNKIFIGKAKIVSINLLRLKVNFGDSPCPVEIGLLSIYYSHLGEIIFTVA
ncbi:MAG: hypothetical protein RSB05_07620, partial [Clostridiales bacterium]